MMVVAFTFNNHFQYPVPLLLFTSLLLIFLTHHPGINAQLENCTLSNIKISTHRTGESWLDEVNGQQQLVKEYLLVISNVCWCPQSNLTLRCDGFVTAEEVNPSLFRLLPRDDGAGYRYGNGSVCLVNDGQPVANGRPIGFRYAWTKRFRFRPHGSKVIC